jgi:hypothetical protein
MADYIEDAEDMVHLHLNATQNVLLSHDLIFTLVDAVSAVGHELLLGQQEAIYMCQ